VQKTAAEPPLGPSGRLVLTRAPGPVLQPYVETLWAVDVAEAAALPSAREHVLPTGQMHLVFRLSGGALRMFDHAGDPTGRFVSDAVVGGARDGHYIRDISHPACSVGAQLRPGAAEALFGTTAEELAGRHTPLEDLWGREVAWMREQLTEARMLHQRIDRLESILAARVAARGSLHPAVACALAQLPFRPTIGRIVEATGYSHRTVISLFRRSVGLTPKQYARVLRFQRALEAVARSPARSLVDVALGAGYSDQAHFSREFRVFCGVTPTEYRRAAPELPNHLAVDPGPR
jgi:AraC-like DNA-binding protein